MLLAVMHDLFTGRADEMVVDGSKGISNRFVGLPKVFTLILQRVCQIVLVNVQQWHL